MRREWLRSTKPHPPARALSARNGIFGCGDQAPEIAERDNELPQRLKRRRTDSGNPGTNGLLEPDGKIPGSAGLGGGDQMDRDWVPTTQSIERVSGRSQEREFSMQRQGDKISDFGTYSTAETAQTKKPGTHVFNISAVSRVSLSHHNYREWVVGTTGIEPVTPTMSR